MIKVFAILILALVLICVILILIIKAQRAEKKTLKCEIEDHKSNYFELNNRYEKLMEELKIEKRNSKELAKRLADISCISIDDVMHQLQNG